MKLIRWKWLTQCRRLGRGVQCHPRYTSLPALTGMSGMSGFCSSPPSAPTGPAIASSAFSSWTVSAATVAGATTYNLYRALHGSTLALYQSGLGSPSYTDSPTFSSSQSAYDYAWSAVGPGGESPKSLTVTLTAVWLDHFTGTNGTSLSSHTPDIGGAYTDLIAGLKIQSNTCQNGTATPNAQAYQSTGISNCSLQAVHTVTAASGEYGALIARSNNPDTNDIQLGVDPGNIVSSGLVIREVNSGVSTIRASAAFSFSTNTPYNLYAKINGSSVTMNFAGTVLSYNSLAANGTNLGARLKNQNAASWDAVLATDKP